MAQQNRKQRKPAKAADQEIIAPKEETKSDTQTDLTSKTIKRIAKTRPDPMHNQASKDLKITGEQVGNKFLTNEGQSDIQQENKLERTVTLHSFFVRVTLDKHGHIRQTEIEHVKSEKPPDRNPLKLKMSGIDKDRLFNFISGIVIPVNKEEENPSPPAPEDKVKLGTKELLELKSGLVITAVQVFQSEDLDMMMFPHPTNESFFVQACFQQQNIDPSLFEAQNLLYEMKVYASNVKSGSQQLLTCSTDFLKSGEKEYTIAAKAPGLLPGIYRLFTYITVGSPIRASGHFEGPVIRIILP